MTPHLPVPTPRTGPRLLGRYACGALAVVPVLLLAGCIPGSAQGGASQSVSASRSVAGRRSGGRSPAPGRVVRRDIAGGSGFAARPAAVYLPAAYLAHPTRRLPVLELLHGTPGSPTDWVTRGQLRGTADAFAAAHGGRAPIIVMPDINGARAADSECIRTASGQDVERYLSEDVVAYVRTAFKSAVGRRRWWIAGLSEGGLCAAVLALRHPDIYSAFGDLSGLGRPTVEHAPTAASDRQLYGADRTAELTHDPVWLLRHRRYPSLAGWFECGVADGKVVRAQIALVAAAAAAGLPTVAAVRPGRHGWSFWRGSLARLLPWLWQQAPT